MKAVRQLLFSLLSIACSAAIADVAVVKGWNLLGNGTTKSIDVASAFSDSSKYITVWKWNTSSSKWAFYAPSMTSGALATYANTKGYEVLTTIASKEGYWVNASTATTVSDATTDAAFLNIGDFKAGWNLLAGYDFAFNKKTPAQFYANYASLLSNNQKSLVTMWSWNSATSNWNFYAPSLDAQGGTALAEYIKTKNYLPFNKTIGISEGFWVNIISTSDVSNGSSSSSLSTSTSTNGNINQSTSTTLSGDNVTIIKNALLNSYPATYTTANRSGTISLCDINSESISYPNSWTSLQNLPEIKGAPLKSSIKTAMVIKDILPDGSLPASCSNPDNIKEYNGTLSRLRLLNTDIILITPWHWVQVNADGSYSITGDTYGSLTDSQVAQYVNAAHAAGFKVMMTNQIQGFVDSTGTNLIATPEGNAKNYQLWVTAFNKYLINRAEFFQSLGVEFWEMGCNGCVYSDAGDNSNTALEIFVPAYEKILPQIANIYKGKRYLYGNTNILTQNILSNIDYLVAGVWNSFDFDSTSEAVVTVAKYKENLNSGIPNLLQYKKPLIVDLGIQSRSNALSVTGYEEETMCTNAIGAKNFNTNCIQAQTNTNFSIQAIVLEAEFEFLSAQELPNESIVRVSDYWQTDFMNPNNQGPTFPNIGMSIRNKPAEYIVSKWFLRK